MNSIGASRLNLDQIKGKHEHPLSDHKDREPKRDTPKWNRLSILIVMFGIILLVTHSDQVINTYNKCNYRKTTYKNCSTNNMSLIFLWKIGEFLDAHNGAVVAIFTIVLAVFTVWLAISTDRLVSEAKTSGERQLRAYVLVDNARVKDVEIGKLPVACLQLKNFGQTPAYKVRHRIEINFSEFPPVSDIPLLETGKNFPKMLIGPGGHIDAIRYLDQPVAESDLEALGRKNFAIYVLGTIDYKDAFEVKRTTHYLFFTNGSQPEGILAPYVTGNDAS